MNNNLEELEVSEFIVTDNETNQRIDKFLASKITNVSRNYLQDLINESYVFVNNKKVKPSYKINLNDQILVYFKEVSDVAIEKENIPLEIIYQDNDIAIINKPTNMATHPSVGHFQHTLVNALMYHIKDLSGINGYLRPGIVHRLDKDTSGLIAIAKNDLAHQKLALQLKDHTMQRSYYCLVKGLLESQKGIIKTLIARDPKNRLKMAVVNDNGKEAITEFEVIETFNNAYSLVRCHLKTGRTHQIRVHMNFIRHPIINDPLYGENNKIPLDCAQLLQAYKLTLIHPTLNELMTFEIPMSNLFNEAIKIIKEANK